MRPAGRVNTNYSTGVWLRLMRSSRRALTVAYAPAWNAHTSTSSYCSRVSFRVIHFRSRKARAVGCGHLSGCSIASRSALSSRTLAFEWYNTRAPPAAPRACFVDCTHHRMSSPTCHRPLLPHLSRTGHPRSPWRRLVHSFKCPQRGTRPRTQHASRIRPRHTTRGTAAASQKNEVHTPPPARETIPRSEP